MNHIRKPFSGNPQRSLPKGICGNIFLNPSWLKITKAVSGLRNCIACHKTQPPPSYRPVAWFVDNHNCRSRCKPLGTTYIKFAPVKKTSSIKTQGSRLSFKPLLKHFMSPKAASAGFQRMACSQFQKNRRRLNRQVISDRLGDSHKSIIYSFGDFLHRLTG